MGKNKASSDIQIVQTIILALHVGHVGDEVQKNILSVQLRAPVQPTWARNIVLCVPRDWLQVKNRVSTSRGSKSDKLVFFAGSSILQNVYGVRSRGLDVFRTCILAHF